MFYNLKAQTDGLCLLLNVFLDQQFDFSISTLFVIFSFCGTP